MLWLIITISAYFLFAFVFLGDKYLLKGPPNPKTYAFYVGIFGALALVLIPFVNFSVPEFSLILLCFLAGAIFIFGIFAIFQGLEEFEASRIIPAMGGFIPVFTLILIYLFSGGKEILGLKEILILLLLVLGSIFITYNPAKKSSFRSLKISALAGLFFSLGFVLSKYVYLAMPFWTGFIWIRIGALLVALFFIFTKEVRQEVFTKKSAFNLKTGVFFILNQAVGAGAFIFQNWAIALAPLAYLSIINALQGIQYLFLFILSLLFYRALKEKISKKIIFQKIFAIALIAIGLIFLAY